MLKGFKVAERRVCNFGEFKIQLLALGGNDCTFDGMLQFSDVAGPGGIDERGSGGRVRERGGDGGVGNWEGGIRKVEKQKLRRWEGVEKSKTEGWGDQEIGGWEAEESGGLGGQLVFWFGNHILQAS